MAGIYLHIPFCKKACFYCDFHFSTQLGNKGEMLNAMIRELEIRKEFLRGELIETIYFGGGTPSLLSDSDINRLLDWIFEHHKVALGVEISLEANPDDLSLQKIQSLRNTKINRFSVGIQSFFDEDLTWMNRAHKAEEAWNSIKNLQQAGFSNISLDLIYGFPLLTDQKWKTNLEKAIVLKIPHLSCYAMTVEPSTALDRFIDKGKTPPMDEDQSSSHFEYMIRVLAEAGFEQYEISSFSLPGLHSAHNSNYWKGRPYLGIGPSAHSFYGNQRSWNVRNNTLYVKQIRAEGPFKQDFENLSDQQRLNEYIMLSLRTMWGLDLSFVEKEFGSQQAFELETRAQSYVKAGLVQISDNSLVIVGKSQLFTDRITADLFF